MQFNAAGYAFGMGKVAIAALVLSFSSPVCAGRYKVRAAKSGETISARRVAVRGALAPTAKVEGAPVASRAPGPAPANLPHNLGLRGSYHSRRPVAPPPASELRPLPSIQQEFLERIALEHAAEKTKAVRVKAAKAGTVGNFDPDRDTEVIVLGGEAPPPVESAGTHNRDQGGKPVKSKKD